MRTSRRFVPEGWDSLEIRQVPSHVVPGPHVHAETALAKEESVAVERAAARHSKAPTVTPIQEINAQFASFSSDFQNAVTLLVQAIALNSASSGSSSSSSSTTTTDDSGTILDSYITNRAAVMAQELVSYFNSLPPGDLPRSTGSPGVPGPHNAVQSYVKQMIVSSEPQSLTQVLIAIPEPTIVGPDLSLYNSTAMNAISATRQQLITGIGMLFQSKTPSPAAPASTTSSTSTPA